MPNEPIWSLDRHEKGDLFWRRDSSKVKFRCEVEVLEFIKDPEEYNNSWSNSRRRYHLRERTASHPVVVVATCVGAIVITVLLPWLMIESNIATE